MSLDSIISMLGHNRPNNIPPVDQWHPESCGDIDIRIDRNCRWFHEGTEIKRETLCKLFASILRKEGEDYFLVTPVEKMRIKVEDVPFHVVWVDRDNDGLQLITNMGDTLQVGDQHPLQDSFIDDANVPVVEVRAGLLARFSRAAFYQLVEFAEEGEEGVFIKSGNYRYQFPLES